MRQLEEDLANLSFKAHKASTEGRVVLDKDPPDVLANHLNITPG